HGDSLDPIGDEGLGHLAQVDRQPDLPRLGGAERQMHRALDPGRKSDALALFFEPMRLHLMDATLTRTPITPAMPPTIAQNSVQAWRRAAWRSLSASQSRISLRTISPHLKSGIGVLRPPPNLLS